MSADSEPGPLVAAAVERTLADRRTATRDRVEALVANCHSLMVETGDPDPPLSLILERSRVSLRAFYSMFESKDAVLVAVLERGVGQALAFVHGRLSEAESPLEVVELWVHGFLDRVCTVPERGSMSLLLQANRFARQFPDDTERLVDQLISPLIEAITALRASANGAGVDARLIYWMLVGAVSEFRVRDKRPDSEFVDRLCRAATRIANPGSESIERRTLGRPAGPCAEVDE